MIEPKPGPSWRKARIAARLLLKRDSQHTWSHRDARVASHLHSDPAVTNRLIDQAYVFHSARKQGRRLLDRAH